MGDPAKTGLDDLSNVRSNGSFEKNQIEHQEFVERGESPSPDPDFLRKTIRKIDLRLLPILGALYSIALIDRTNISLARVAGMDVELELTVGNRYSIVSLMFFVPYIILELPSNILLRKFGTARWLTFISVSWGAVTIGMGFVHSWGALTACRALLGALEAGFFPACAFVIATWYTRYETGKRMSGFYLISLVISGFSGILAYGLVQMGGTAGIRGWRWIFIIEGVITCAFGMAAYFLIVDFPDKNKFLTAEQTTMILTRIEKERGDTVYEPLTWPLFRSHISDLKLWGFALMFMASTMPSYAFAYFLPVILTGMGYTVKESQLLTAPPYIVCAPYAMALAWLSDRTHNRSRVIIFQATCCLVGLLLVAYLKNNHARYFGVFMGLAGANSNVPATLAWMNNSILGSSKRSVGSAMAIGFGGIGGILATTVFVQKDAPRYLKGLWITVGLQFLTIILALTFTTYFSRANKKVRAGEKVIEGREGFEYTL
ncbi:Permease of the major facilitator superfamily [Phaffia rhodozyma]|uniref:Permease of the major facilitator superfamily n=1 Tax=Phaffia rhodozyma TaxID=264483 RepID=A0A0F7SRN2_PHARH|nr:Permease of the major facilitator superfamily [Phaffia rhodozyma]